MKCGLEVHTGIAGTGIKAVLSIGKISGGVRMNVIAEKVEMEGTVRIFSFEIQDLIEKGIENVLKGLQASLDTSYDFKFNKGGKYVKNDIVLTRMILPVFRKLLGQSNVHIIEPITGAKDFAAYSHLIPSFFFFLGVGENNIVHIPTFPVKDESFNYGPLLLSTTALEYLQSRI